MIKNMIQMITLIFLITTTVCCGEDRNVEDTVKGDTTYQIKISSGEKIVLATLNDSAASRDFVKMLPLRLKLDDYANTEKVSGLPGKLSTKGSPSGFDPSVGSITYYAPWGNLAIFYKDFGYASGLVALGEITKGIEHLQVSGSLMVSIELIQ